MGEAEAAIADSKTIVEEETRRIETVNLRNLSILS
jgi:hypothetical protein